MLRKVKARLRSQRGLTLIPIVVAIAIIGLLLLSSFHQSRTQREIGMTRAGRRAGQATACEKTRAALEGAVRAWVMNNPDKAITERNLQADGIVITRCPQGGRYSVSGAKIFCSLHPG